MTRKERWIVGAGVAAALAAAAYTSTASAAAENITYTYDARGRLIKVQRTIGTNAMVTTNYVIDNAENRALKNTT